MKNTKINRGNGRNAQYIYNNVDNIPVAVEGKHRPTALATQT